MTTEESVAGVIATREVSTALQEETAHCTAGGVGHDFRVHHGEQFGRPHRWLRCVWCHGVTCGYVSQDDPCMELYHHDGDHLSAAGVRWPKGGTRPDVVLADR